MSDLDSRIESFRSALQSDDERENVKTPSAPNLPPPPGVTKEGGFGGGGKEAAELGRRLRRRRRREVMVKRAELGLRVCEVILCLVSFCVMMSDKSRGWAGDSYYRYMEFRYCVAVTLIGFAYSGFQACDLTYNLITGNHILAYLLVSASSSAATRIDDWVSNWGEDKFTDMATLSVAMSLLAFAALALSTLISGYNLSTIA
ncbi:hypothetical protein RHSIM_Rhsim08G0171300 [Rhododendron simsii]|uniref:CASP-like protein n=1 Tax=Rhododendron simsii TaxID=118357 RepID=A0A834LFQ2_RHOSS|nr:hypothetical protein RHSIM_Rhsim08G0171300 [Rhododendron simsii]